MGGLQGAEFFIDDQKKNIWREKSQFSKWIAAKNSDSAVSIMFSNLKKYAIFGEKNCINDVVLTQLVFF